MIITKLCMSCFRKRFGEDAKIGTVTWAVQCQACHAPTPSRGLLIKVTQEMVS